MVRENNLTFEGFWKTLATAAGWILTVVSATELLVSPIPDLLITAVDCRHRNSSRALRNLQCLLPSAPQFPRT